MLFTARYHLQAGLSLVELMVALTIGLILLAGVAQIFLGTKQGFNTQQEISRVQETGRFATLFLTRTVRQAGYMSDHTRRPSQVFTGTMAVTGTNADPDTISVSYQGSADNNTLDCRGDPVAVGAISTNTFSVDTAAQSLRCDRNDGAGAQPLVSGVQDMQIQYGVDTTPTNAVRAATRYITANQIPAVANWTDVRSVRITLTVTDDTNRLEPKTFTSTINVRNRLDDS